MGNSQSHLHGTYGFTLVYRTTQGRRGGEGRMMGGRRGEVREQRQLTRNGKLENGCCLGKASLQKSRTVCRHHKQTLAYFIRADIF